MSEGTGPHTLNDRSGFYQITGTAAQVTAELDAILFTPQPPTAGRTTTGNPYLLVNSSSGFYAGDAGTYVYDTTPPDSMSLSPQVTYRDGVFTLTGTVSTALGVTGVGIDAIVDGVPTNLGATTVDASGNFTSADRLGPHTQGFITAVTLAQGSGNYSSATDNRLVERERDVTAAHRGPMAVLAEAAVGDRVSTDLSAFALSTGLAACGKVTSSLGGQVFDLCAVRRDPWTYGSPPQRIPALARPAKPSRYGPRHARRPFDSCQMDVR